eukprot:TRINITY_DN93603_c0_g1_i1.p1 TRINITY_DN93603_c0_g1~~TRINITY_DN93603_c0_g1_i1.p1  ORF type:complete len:145 (+),score=16.73 TRINITY_DN93603_c0_g1_i1:73-507(+)
MYKQPSINSTRANAFLTSHICFQDRIRKELYGGLPADKVNSFDEPLPEESRRKLGLSASGSLTIQEERFAKGSSNRFNNNSTGFAMTLAPQSWKGSGGVTTLYRQTHGPVTSFPDVGGPMGLRHQILSVKQDRKRVSSMPPGRF